MEETAEREVKLHLQIIIASAFLATFGFEFKDERETTPCSIRIRFLDQHPNPNQMQIILHDVYLNLYLIKKHLNFSLSIFIFRLSNLLISG